jgi:hypothetical protein
MQSLAVPLAITPSINFGISLPIWTDIDTNVSAYGCSYSLSSNDMIGKAALSNNFKASA